ncbi:hypothetical protein [Abyssogena phaseoliformis symbiont]|uniref:hypothetical protein n=1 Tax=Abyssogena phaseoliformis symbiont TaxID=596095 RepID=UPI00191613A2|nr:hypothetical protein [Abyssogena phaseoliformis symbiont]
MIGRIRQKPAYFLNSHCGKAQGENDTYALSTSAASGSPIVQSQKTGKAFTLEWQEILELAEEAGISDIKQEVR